MKTLLELVRQDQEKQSADAVGQGFVMNPSSSDAVASHRAARRAARQEARIGDLRDAGAMVRRETGDAAEDALTRAFKRAKGLKMGLGAAGIGAAGLGAYGLGRALSNKESADARGDNFVMNPSTSDRAEAHRRGRRRSRQEGRMSDLKSKGAMTRFDDTTPAEKAIGKGFKRAKNLKRGLLGAGAVGAVGAAAYGASRAGKKKESSAFDQALEQTVLYQLVLADQ